MLAHRFLQGDRILGFFAHPPSCRAPHERGWAEPPNYRSACSAAAIWYLRRIAAMSTWGFGSFRSISSMVSAMIWEMARLRNHLWLDGMTYHGACGVLVRSIASSNAAT